MSDDRIRDDEPNPKPRPVKRPAKPRAEWLVPRGIAWVDDGVTIRARPGAEIEPGIIPSDLIDEYAGRGDIIRINTSGKA